MSGAFTDVMVGGVEENRVGFLGVFRISIMPALPNKRHKKNLSKIAKVFFVVPPGFEPGLKEPKSSVLPLHNGTNSSFRFSKAMQI